ncbi:MAG: DDE-type integrase/transposase/recombinase [Nitrososphaera sp.]
MLGGFWFLAASFNTRTISTHVSSCSCRKQDGSQKGEDSRCDHVCLDGVCHSINIAQSSKIKLALVAFKQAIANAHGLLPNEIRTDSLNSYNHVVKTTLPDAKHVANCGIRKRHANNNRIERLNGTMRERVKVQRGWKTVKTELAEGQRIQYNFVKPHMALEGNTPANAAGLDVKGWKELLELALSTNQARTTKGNTQ